MEQSDRSRHAAAGPTLQLEAQAEGRVPNDEMVVNLSVERDGTELPRLNEQVKSLLNQVLDELKADTRLSARLLGYATDPRWDPKRGVPTGWVVRGEIQIEGKDLPAVAQVAGRLTQKMMINGIQFRLSTAARQTEEQRLVQEVARQFAQKAGQAAQAFGFSGYEVQHLNLGGHSGESGFRAPMALRASAKAEADPLPSQPGTSTVTVSVSGTVLLRR